MKNNKVLLLLKSLEEKKTITEIMINDVNKVFVENKGETVQIKVDLTLEDINKFIKYVYVNNKKNYQNSPFLDGILSDGSRINIVKMPFVKKCPAITIRKYIRSIKGFDDQKKYFGVDSHWHKFLKALIRARCNIIVAGGTGVGKTTFLNSLINEIDISERIVTIEDTFELDIHLPNVVNLEAGKKVLDDNVNVTIGDLLKSSLRMKPNRIIVGESRGGELFDLLQAMNTGHTGSMSSIHSNSSKQTLSRMESLFLMSGHSLETVVVRKQIATTIDYIIYLSLDNKKNRIIESILEITGMEAMNILSQKIATFQDGHLLPTGLVPENIEDLVKVGLKRNFFNHPGNTND